MFQQSTPPPKIHMTEEKPPKEKSGWGKFVGWLVILIGVTAIAYMLMTHYREPKLVCSDMDRGQNSLIQMGTCSEQ